MASDQSFVDYVVDQFDADCQVTSRKMFGEYGLFGNGKIFALICDNQLFIKPTDPGRNFIGDVTEAPPYPGAKPSFLIDEGLDDASWLSNLARVTLDALPAPKPKRKKKKKKRAT